MNVDIKEVIITIINFIILLLILRHFLFDRLNNLIVKRQNEIDYTIKITNENELKASSYVLESAENLKQSRVKGESIVENYKVNAEKLSEEILKEARREAQLLMERAAKETQREKEKAEYELKKHTIDLAVLLSAKALGDTIDEEQHRKLIQEFISKVGA